MNNIDFLPINIKEDNTYWGSESLNMNVNFSTIKDFLDYIRKTTYIAQTNSLAINDIKDLDNYTTPGSYSVTLNSGVSGELPSLNGAYDFTLNVFKANKQGSTIIQQQIFNHQVYQRVVPEEQWERNTFSDIERRIVDKIIEKVDINNSYGSFLKTSTGEYTLGLLNTGKPIYTYIGPSNTIVKEELATKEWVSKILEEGGIDPGPGGFATTKYVDDKIADLVGSSPEALDTLKELADALGNDPNFATTVLNKLAVLENLWKVDDKGRLYSDMAVYSTKALSAKGPASGSGGGSGGINETLLWSLLGDGDNPNKQIALSHLLLMQSWTTSNFVNQATLAGYATQSWVQSRGYITTNALTNYVVKEPGKGLSTNDFTESYRSKLDSLSNYVLPIASSSVLGGIKVGTGLLIDPTGILNINISENNIPSLPISKITGLQSALDNKLSLTGGTLNGNLYMSQPSKLGFANGQFIRDNDAAGLNVYGGSMLNLYALNNNVVIGGNKVWHAGNFDPNSKLDASVFNDLFEKVNIGTAGSPKYIIRAKYGLSTNFTLSAKGIAQSGGSGGGGINKELLWNILGDDGTEKISNTHLNIASWALQPNKPIYSYSEITGTPPAVDLSNYVTTDTPQTIKGQKTFVSDQIFATGAYFGTNKKGTLHADGSITAEIFRKTGGIASQFLKADGSVDSNTYVTTNTEQNISGRKIYSTNQYYNNNIGIVTIDGQGLLFSDGTRTITGDATRPHRIRSNNSNLTHYKHGIGEYDILDSSNWASIVDGRYLHLTGGTVIGEFILDRTSGGYMRFFREGSNLGYIGQGSSINDGLRFQNDISTKSLTLLNSGDITYGGSRIWHAGNDGASSGLDADMLDGLHLKQITKYPVYHYTQGCLVYTNIPATTAAMCSARIRGNSYGGGLPIDSYIEFYNYPTENSIISSAGLHNGYNFGDVHVFTFNNEVCLWFKQVGNFQSFEVEVVQTNGVTTAYNRVTYIENTVKPSNIQRSVIVTPKQSALITSNVASATVLQTARSIWGQPFKGDSNIEGPMYGVRSITGLANTAVDYLSQVGHYFYSYNKPTPLMSLLDGYIGISTTNPQWTFHVNGDTYTHEWFRVKHSRGLYIQDASVYYTNSANYACISSNGNEVVFSGADSMYVNYRGDGTTGRAIPKKWYWRAGTSDSWAGMEIGNLGVNGDLRTSGAVYSSASLYAADAVYASGRIFTGYDSGVTGSMSCSNWFRSNDATGWFSGTFGGGIHMKDPNYVRVYNGKAFAVDNTSFSAINNQGGYYSNKNNSYENLWVNSLDPTKAIFNAATTLSVGTNSYRNMIGWIDQINNVGYLTRYSIGSVRRDSGWGEMALCVGNSDNGTSANLLLLGGNGDARWSGTFYSKSIIADDVLKSTAGRLDLGLASFQYDPVKKLVKLILADGTPCGFAATGQLAAKGIAPNTSRGLNDTQVYNEVFSLRSDSDNIKTQITNLNLEITQLKAKIVELNNKLPA